MNKKIILLGHYGVGKSSLVRRFVHSQFSEEYITTIGVKIDKKTIQVGDVSLTLLIWDIAGENGQQKIPQSYRLGAHGAIYVFDLSRPATYANLENEILALQELLPGIPIQILANKLDLSTESQIAEVMESIRPYQAKATSAKTGEHVDEAFELLARKILE